MKTVVPHWLSAGLLGLVIGFGGAILVMQALGYGKPPSARSPGSGDPTKAAMASIAAANPSAGSGGGMMGGMGGMMGGGAGAMGGPAGAGAARSLVTMVGKLDLLTQGVRIELTSEQQKRLIELLADLGQASELSEEQARARLDEMEELLSVDQRKVLDSIDLPRRRGGGAAAAMMGGGRNPASDAATAQTEAARGGGKVDEKSIQDAMRQKTAGPLLGAPGGGNSAPRQDTNPFRQEENARPLKSLRDRLQVGAGGS